MESNQVHVIAGAVFSGSQQIIHTLKTRFMGQFVRDVIDADVRNRIHDNVALFHRIPTANLDVGAHPDANGASDSPVPDRLAQMFAKHHIECPRSGRWAVAVSGRFPRDPHCYSRTF